MRLVELYEQYRDRVAFLVVYVREAHPTDKWWLAESRTLQATFDLSNTLARSDVDGAPTQEMVHDYLWALQFTISGGTSQVQRNIIGERILGLPREPR